MFRASLQRSVKKQYLRSPLNNKHSSRNQSTGGEGGTGKLGVLLGVAGVSVAAVGGSVVYANSQLSKQMEKLEKNIISFEKSKQDKDIVLKKKIEEKKAEEQIRLAEIKMSLELEKRKAELEGEYQLKLNSIRETRLGSEQFEVELHNELKRQLAAHLDHLNDRLAVQKIDLERKFGCVLEEKLVEEKSRYNKQLMSSVAKLREIETVLKSRQQLDREERKTRELWLVCQVLRDALKSRRDQKTKEPISLAKDITSIKETVKTMEPSNKLTLTALESIPETALKNGVFTEDDLIDRFNKVEKICRKVALIGDEGGSIFRYFLSYLQAALLFNRSCNYSEEVNGTKTIDPSTWDTFDILSRVRYCLNERNLEMSLRYANQLKGESRKVAKDWINDMRVHLELRQVVDILQAQASAFTVRAVK